MKSILLSIKPIYVQRIFSGTKCFEFRKRIPLDVQKVVIYETSPTKKIVGEFQVKRIIKASPQELWMKTKAKAGIDKVSFYKYFEDSKEGFAIEILAPICYDRQKSLEEMGVKFVPQSWIYFNQSKNQG